MKTKNNIDHVKAIVYALYVEAFQLQSLAWECTKKEKGKRLLLHWLYAQRRKEAKRIANGNNISATDRIYLMEEALNHVKEGELI